MSPIQEIESRHDDDERSALEWAALALCLVSLGLLGVIL